jgi:hypothetical protein
MQLHLQNMERAAEQALQGDSTFYEALQALKYEIDSDTRVRAAIHDLQAAGREVFSSFVPYIRIRIRTSEGTLSLPRQSEKNQSAPVEQIARLTQELRNAASDVIMRSGHRQELDSIVNEAIGASASFEGIASEIEEAGHEVLICLDLSTYAQVRESSTQSHRISQPKVLKAHKEPLNHLLLSDRDLKFLKALKIKS